MHTLSTRSIVTVFVTALVLLAGCNRTDSPPDQPTQHPQSSAQTTTAGSSLTINKPAKTAGNEAPPRNDHVALGDDASAATPKHDAGKQDATGPAASSSSKDASSAVGTEILGSKSEENVAPEALDHYRKALQLAKDGQTAAAKDEFTEALRIQPDFDVARADFGKFLLSQGDTITASIVYKKGVELHPNDSDAHNNYGVVLIRASDVSGARREFEKAIALKDENAQAHHNLGVLLSTLGELDESIAQHKTAIHLEPIYVDARLDLGRALMRKGKDHLEDAAAQFREVLRLRPGHFGALYNLGLTLTMLGRSGDAIKEYTQALRTSPENAELRLALGRALVEHGNHRQAISQFTEALRLQPDNADVHYDLALALAKLGRIDEAIAHNKEALFLRPDWPEALNNLAWILATTADSRLHDPKRAVDLANRARELADYKMPLVLDTQAAALADAGKFPEAVKTAEKAIALAREAHQDDVAKLIAERLALYRAGKAFRESPAPNDAAGEKSP
jgi:tetratricopeptide (TPR) repeat protein